MSRKKQILRTFVLLTTLNYQEEYIRKLIADLLSVCVVGGSLSAIYSHSPNIAAFASAEAEKEAAPEYKEAVDES